MVKQRFFYLLIVIVLLNLLFSCKKRNGIDVTVINIALDSVTYLDGTALKYFYKDGKITHANRYILWEPPEKQLIGKIVYHYDSERIIEKYRIYLPNNSISWKQHYTYSGNGKLKTIRFLKKYQLVDLFFTKSLLEINYSGDDMLSSELTIWDDNDTTKQTTKYGYNYFMSNNNINKALPLSTNNYGFDEYYYSVSNQINPLSNNNLFLAEYNISNLETGAFIPELLPVFINKSKTELYINSNFPWMKYSFEVKSDAKERPVSAHLYYNNNYAGIWKFFYR
jgi:hypothetical protein